MFVLTSFGAYWHLLVGYRRPRLPTEYAGKCGVSDTFYVSFHCPILNRRPPLNQTSSQTFQKIWSGHVIHEELAAEFLWLIDQIHLWAITDFRTFILEHLRRWHQLCDEDFLLEGDSKYDSPASKKRKRGLNESNDLMVAGWVAELDEQGRTQFQSRSKLSLQRAIRKSQLINGKSQSYAGTDVTSTYESAKQILVWLGEDASCSWNAVLMQTVQSTWRGAFLIARTSLGGKQSQSSLTKNGSEQSR